MDFANRNSQPASPRTEGTGATGVKNALSSRKSKLLKAGSIALLFCIVGLVVALLLLFNFSDSSEGKYVQEKKLQSVFLNNGQVYFGNIKSLNDKYIDLTNIYYLRTNSGNTNTTAASANDVSLVKLGCELHGPTDEMIINRDQVTFWENLKPDGQVAKAIATYKQQNPNGQNCTTTTNGTQQAPSATAPANTSGAGTTTTGTGTAPKSSNP